MKTGRPVRSRRGANAQPVAVAAAEAVAPAVPQADPLRSLKLLIWLYFGLLLFEGALRKWALPSLANPLLIIRDPVLLLIYALAVNRRLFPANGFVITIGFLALLSFIASFATEFGDFRVALFGARCNFLHLPLIFIIGRVFNIYDVRRVGWGVLLLALPMAALMAMQFQSPGGAWVNRGAGEDASMIASVHGRIRPSGTFSFVSGIIYFWGLAMAFLVYGLVQKRTYPWWLTLGAGAALPVALAVSSSRSTVASCVIVLLAFAAAVFCRPQLALKATKLFVIGFILASAVGGMTLFQEGMEIFKDRVEHAGEVEGGASGFVQRFVDQFRRPLTSLLTVPLFGYGLGSGTNVGAKLLTGEVEFLLAEDEWERVILESGPAFGLAYLLLRVSLVCWLGWLSWRAARIGHFLPLLLTGACAWLLISGPMGQTTTIGFAVMIAGLTLASLKVPTNSIPELVRAKQRRAAIVPAKVRAQWAAIQARKAAARRKPTPGALVFPAPSQPLK